MESEKTFLREFVGMLKVIRPRERGTRASPSLPSMAGLSLFSDAPVSPPARAQIRAASG